MMSLKAKAKEIRDNYVINQVQRAKLPEFEGSRICRYQILFSGRVQKVGFRLEVCEMAKRLGLVGFCENLENGDVMAQLQGEEERIQFLIVFMKSLRRIKIYSAEITEVDLVSGETEVVRL